MQNQLLMTPSITSKSELSIASAMSTSAQESSTASFSGQAMPALSSVSTVPNITCSSAIAPIECNVSSTISPQPSEECWVKHGDISLSRKDLQQILKGKELSDMHVNCFSESC